MDKFSPDVLWFDFGWHRDEFEPWRPQVAAYYYNHALEHGYEPVLQYKDKFPDGTAVLDIERGKLDDIRPDYWQTDTSVSYKSWGYIEDDEFKSTDHARARSGRHRQQERQPAAQHRPAGRRHHPRRGAGAAARSGRVAGDQRRGDLWHAPLGALWRRRHARVVGHLTEKQNVAFKASDIRFTTHDDALYAILLGWPEGEALVKSLGCGSGVTVQSVSLLGDDSELVFSQDEAGLHVTMPAARPCEHAYTLKLIVA